MSRPKMIPGPDHPITIEPTGGCVVVRVGGQLVAETSEALTMKESTYAPVQYIPIADVDATLLRSTSGATYCPFKGDASYFALQGPDGEIEDAIWTYEQPYEAVGEIEGHVAFYPEHVEISIG